MSKMTIARLAAAVGVGVETVRYYQRRRLMVEPARPGGSGFRSYGEDDVRRLRFIRQAQAAGFTLDEIGELLDLDATEDRDRARDLANRRIAALEKKIAELRKAQAALTKLANECAGSASGPCPIIAAFDR